MSLSASFVDISDEVIPWSFSERLLDDPDVAGSMLLSAHEIEVDEALRRAEAEEWRVESRRQSAAVRRLQRQFARTRRRRAEEAVRRQAEEAAARRLQRALRRYVAGAVRGGGTKSALRRTLMMQAQALEALAARHALEARQHRALEDRLDTMGLEREARRSTRAEANNEALRAAVRELQAVLRAQTEARAAAEELVAQQDVEIAISWADISRAEAELARAQADAEQRSLELAAAEARIATLHTEGRAEPGVHPPLPSPAVSTPASPCAPSRRGGSLCSGLGTSRRSAGEFGSAPRARDAAAAADGERPPSPDGACDRGPRNAAWQHMSASSETDPPLGSRQRSATTESETSADELVPYADPHGSIVLGSLAHVASAIGHCGLGAGIDDSLDSLADERGQLELTGSDDWASVSRWAPPVAADSSAGDSIAPPLPTRVPSPAPNSAPAPASTAMSRG